MTINFHLNIDWSLLNNKLNTIMTNIADLNAKLDALQTSLDAKQAAIEAGFAALKQQIADLISAGSGATPDQLQALSDKIDTIGADLATTEEA